MVRIRTSVSKWQIAPPTNPANSSQYYEMSVSSTPNAKAGGLPVIASLLRTSLPELRQGLVCVFQCNARHAYVVPSTQNFIQFTEIVDTTVPTLQIRGAKLDHGATRSLFYFSSSAAFVNFIENAPTAEQSPEHGILYYIKYNSSPSGSFATLQMARVYGFSLYLATDVVTPSTPIKLQELAFHLCSEDIDELTHCTRLPNRVRLSLIQYRTSLGNRTVARRRWALLGNDINDQFALFKARKVFFMCNMKVFRLRSYEVMVLDEFAVLSMNYLSTSNPDSAGIHQIRDETVSLEAIDLSEFL